MEKKDKHQSALVATTLLLGCIFAVSVVIHNIDSSADTDIVEKTYAGIQPEAEQSLDAAIITQSALMNEISEKDLLIENMNIESVEITSGTFADAFKQARMLLGPGNTFVWNGMVFTTNLADEDSIPIERYDLGTAGIDLASELPIKEPTLSHVIETTP